jgi:hypothetical protein
MPYRKRASAKERQAEDAAVADLKIKRDAFAKRLEQAKGVCANAGPSCASRIADLEVTLRELDEYSASRGKQRTSPEITRKRRFRGAIRKVSCICVTRDRPHLLPIAIDSYLSQDWPEKELIVVDDGITSYEQVAVVVPGAIYVRPERNWGKGLGLTIGAKRNLACSRATGDVFVHLDDDDWSAPTRISEQVKTLIETGKCLTTFYALKFWDVRNSVGYDIPIQPGGGKILGYGTSMCYRREWWEAHPFVNTSRGEDNESILAARSRGQLVTTDGSTQIVVLIHNRNTTQYPLECEIPIESFPAAFFDAFARAFCGSTNAFKRTMEDIAGRAGGLSQWTPEVV